MGLIQVNVKLSDPLWQQPDDKEISVVLASGATEADLVDELVELYPVFTDFLTDAELPVLAIRREELLSSNTTLADGDTITFLLAMTGG